MASAQYAQYRYLREKGIKFFNAFWKPVDDEIRQNLLLSWDRFSG